MKNRIPILITLMLGTAMAALDSSIVNVSLPSIQKDFKTDINNIQWVTSSYMLAFCLFIPLTNWLHKRLGYYKLLMGCITLFVIGSLVCSLSESVEMLITARVFQALGGGGLSPVSLAIINNTFPKDEKGTAVSWWGMGNVIAPALGPTIGGLLTEYLGWPSIFYVNVPMGIIAIIMSVKYLSFLKKEPTSKTQFALSGYIFFAVFIVLLQVSIGMLGNASINIWQPVSGILISMVCLYLFIKNSRTPDSLIDISVFKIKTFNRSAMIIFIRSVALFGGLFFLPFLLQNLMGYSEFETGMLMLPNTLITLFFRPYAGKLADKGIIRTPSVIGIICLALSMVQFGVLNNNSLVVWVMVGMFFRGFGMAMLVSPVSTALLNSVTTEQSSSATSINSLLMQVGGSTGITISALLHSLINQHYENTGMSAINAEQMGLMYGFFISGFIVLLALIPAMKLPNHNKKELGHHPLSVSVGTG